MSNNEYPPKKSREEFREELRQLAISAVEKLRDVELDDVADRIPALFKKSSEKIFNDEYNFQLKPMLELLLRDIIGFAGKPGLSKEERLKEINESFKLSGLEDESTK